MYRKLDALGRIVIPVEYRKKLGIKEGDEVQMILLRNEIMIKKSFSNCVFCNGTDCLVSIDNTSVCRSCIERLYNAEDGEALY